MRPDGTAKVRGEFAFAGDLWAEGMLWGRTLRSPHPSARIRCIDTARGARDPRRAGRADRRRRARLNRYGLEHRDQPVLRRRRGPLRGRAGRRGGRRPSRHRPAGVRGDRRRLRGARAARSTPTRGRQRPPSIRTATCSATWSSAAATPRRSGRSWSRAPTRSGCRTRRSWAPRPGLAIPADDGGVDLIVSTQWLHNDRDQVAECLGLPAEQVRLSLGGVGGAFGAREDVSLHIHACLLAPTHRATGQDRVLAGRSRSSATCTGIRPGSGCVTAPSATAARELRVADPPRRRRVPFVELSRRAPTPPASRPGRTASPTRTSSASAVRTNNPPCGAMRGFGAVQVVLRPRGADGSAGRTRADRSGRASAAQRARRRATSCLPASASRARCPWPRSSARLRRAARCPMPASDDVAPARPGGAGRTADAERRPARASGSRWASRT